MTLDLPFKALIDTSVFLCRLGDKADDGEAQACIDFCDRMAKANRSVFVAAPTITEITRYQGQEVPKVPGIVVVAFDVVAATQLGKKMPNAELKAWRDGAPGRVLGHIRYDALIVGCALRVPGCAFVGMDTSQLALAKHVGLAAHHPREFYKAPKPTAAMPAQQPLQLAVTSHSSE